MNTTRIKSPLGLARNALETAQQGLPTYSSKYSRKDYTQHQLYALLTLRQFLKTDYRGLEQMLREWTDLREAVGLKKVPDHSTLQRADRRLRGSPRRAEPVTTPDAPAPATPEAA